MYVKKKTGERGRGRVLLSPSAQATSRAFLNCLTLRENYSYHFVDVVAVKVKQMARSI